MPPSIAIEALALSRAGDRDGAILILQTARDNAPLDEPATSLLFTLLGDRGDDSDDDVHRLALCDHALTLARRPIQQSTWHLRRGLLRLVQREPAAALVDFQRVLQLRASDDHLERARTSLLEVAALMGTAKKR